MKFQSLNTKNIRVPRNQDASLRIILAVLIAAIVGAGAALWYQSVAKKPARDVENATGTSELSSATLAVLSSLSSPVDIRFYAILDPNSVASELKNFATRTDQLLVQYEAAGDGMIALTRFTVDSDMGPQSAAKDGVAPFNLDKGDACYLGIAVQAKDQKESFARLSLDWEGALESDLSRAIARVASGKPVNSTPAISTATDPGIINEVKQKLPDLATLTVEQGSQRLRESAMKDAQAAIAEMQGQIQAAQERLAESRASGSEAEQQAALRDFQNVQAEQAKKIQTITSRLQAQLEALQAMKSE